VFQPSPLCFFLLQVLPLWSVGAVQLTLDTLLLPHIKLNMATGSTHIMQVAYIEPRNNLLEGPNDVGWPVKRLFSSLGKIVLKFK
jgi:hypothetical protein